MKIQKNRKSIKSRAGGYVSNIKSTFQVKFTGRPWTTGKILFEFCIRTPTWAFFKEKWKFCKLTSISGNFASWFRTRVNRGKISLRDRVLRNSTCFRDSYLRFESWKMWCFFSFFLNLFIFFWIFEFRMFEKLTGKVEEWEIYEFSFTIRNYFFEWIDQ